jgi:RNA polymerase sigma factor (sigma-70 family)
MLAALAMAHEPIDPELSTYEVWRRAQENDPRATASFNKLFAYIRDEVRRHPRLPALRTHCDADDIVSDVIVRGCTDLRLKSGQFETRGVGSLRVYLRKFIDSAICDRIRERNAVKRNGGQINLSLDDTTPSGQTVFQPASPDPTPSGIASGREFDESFLSGLEGRDREVWLLHVRDGLPFADIAARLSMTESAARSRYDRIVKRIELDPN